MHIAVPMLYCNDAPRRTTFTLEWVEKAMAVAAGYYAAQSAGKVSLTWQVFDWLDVGMSETDWVKLSSAGIDGVVTLIQPQLPVGTDLLGGFDHILIGIDTQNSSGGTTPGAYTFLGASNFTPSFIGHELGHRFGADDAYGSDGTIYQNRFCVMGANWWPHTFDAPSLLDGAPNLAGTGPNMSAPTLMRTGWLDVNQHGVYVDLAGSMEVNGGGASVELAALTGSPGTILNRAPVAVRYGPYVIEYRVPRGWDAGLPQPTAGGSGWLVVHNVDPAAPRANFVAATEAFVGVTLLTRPDNVLDLGSPGPLTIRVVAVDPNLDTVRVSLSKRPAIGILQGQGVGTLGNGGDGGALVWTPGGGLRRIPPYSPLLGAAELLSEVAALHDLTNRTAAEQLNNLSELTASKLHQLQTSIAQLPATAPISPMQQALSELDALDNARLRIADQLDHDSPVQQYLEVSHTAIQQLRAITQTAARTEPRG